MPKRPQPYYARLTQPPRSPNGRNRQAAATNHSDPLDGASAGAGGAKAGTITINAISFQPGAITYIDPGVNPGIVIGPVLSLADYAKMLMDPRWDAIAPLPIPYTGIHSGEITGHRAWLVTEDFSLCSLAHYFIWEPGKTIEGDINEVVSRSPSNRWPDRFGGVYAYRDFENLRDDELTEAAKRSYRFPYRERRPSKLEPMSVGDSIRYDELILETITYLGLVYGTVKLWGETVEHEKGYRASFAKVTGIDGFIGVKGFELERLRGKYLP